jgi:hypothetical protein
MVEIAKGSYEQSDRLWDARLRNWTLAAGGLGKGSPGPCKRPFIANSGIPIATQSAMDSIEVGPGRLWRIVIVNSLSIAKLFSHRSVSRVFLAVLILLSCGVHLEAQSTNASLTGRITDASKAVVANARVIVINTGTRVRY